MGKINKGIYGIFLHITGKTSIFILNWDDDDDDDDDDVNVVDDDDDDDDDDAV